MTTGNRPEDRHLSETTGESKRSLATWLAVLAAVLVVLLIIFFWWWSREGEETDDEDVTRIELVEWAHHSTRYLTAA